jgi:hypothetical protein
MIGARLSIGILAFKLIDDVVDLVVLALFALGFPGLVGPPLGLREIARKGQAWGPDPSRAGGLAASGNIPLTHLRRRREALHP